MFMDLNLKLAIIYQLRKQRLLPKFNKKKFWKQTFGITYDAYADYNYERVSEVADYYNNYVISPELFLKVDELTWIEFDIIYDIYDQWDGEDNQFEIASLEGIEQCQGIGKISISVGMDPYKWEGLEKTYVSLNPLIKLPHLTELKISGYMQDVSAVLLIRSLKQLSLNGNVPTAVDIATLKESLIGKGVEVKELNLLV
jgi:hypothetical protein